MPARMTLDDFLRKAKIVHGDKYDYSKVEFVNARTKIMIICPIHGAFMQEPSVHLKGHGCKQCGIESALSHSDYSARAVVRKNTFMSRYGVENPMQMQSVKDKIKETCLEKYGVENPRQNKAVVDKARQTNIERYGDISFAKTETGLQKIKDTMQEKYGADNFMRSESAKAVIPGMVIKSKQTQLEKYGAEHYMLSEEGKGHISDYKKREFQTKKENHCLNTSSQEQFVLSRLTGIFGKDDISESYSDDRYPFHCDFYIKSLDLFIELNIHWSHGGHPFGSCPNDSAILAKWKEKNNEYYDGAVDTWSRRDAVKFNTARDNKLNYIVFWRSDLWDLDLWIAMGCPVGRDYERIYSYLPVRYLDTNCFADKPLYLSNVSYHAKQIQCGVFYEKELTLWNNNAFVNKANVSMPLQAYIYQNRYHYLGKCPDELSGAEILRSFGIIGLHKSYTSFNAELMSSAIDKYHFRSVYDPCAGWGERMLISYLKDVKYDGVDINTSLENGYAVMISKFDMKKQTFRIADSARYEIQNGYDAVITCPPYGDIEIYSDKGAENLDNNAFIHWWENVVKRCSDAGIQYFCFQINQKYRDSMLAVFPQFGYELIDELFFKSNKSSHFTRKNGIDRKREYESMLILKKISKTS